MKTKSFLNIKNKNIFVIGGSGFIGSEISKSLVEQNSKIVILDIKKPSINKKRIHFYKLDICDLDNLEKNILKLLKKHGTPNALINASYPYSKEWSKSDFFNITLKNYENNISMHLNSFVWSSKIFADAMKKKKDGSIILLNSIYGMIGQDLSLYKNTFMKENMTYSVIKGGISNFVKQSASYYGKFNIRINSICAGGLEGHIQGNKKIQHNNFKKKYISKTPLNRMGKPRDLVGIALFLCSSKANYITGTNILVDGGYSAI